MSVEPLGQEQRIGGVSVWGKVTPQAFQNHSKVGAKNPYQKTNMAPSCMNIRCYGFNHT